MVQRWRGEAFTLFLNAESEETHFAITDYKIRLVSEKQFYNNYSILVLKATIHLSMQKKIPFRSNVTLTCGLSSLCRLRSEPVIDRSPFDRQPLGSPESKIRIGVLYDYIRPWIY